MAEVEDADLVNNAADGFENPPLNNQRPEPNESKEYPPSGRRWALLALFMVLSASNAYQWIYLNIIYHVTVYYWQPSLPEMNAVYAVDWFSMVFMILYVFMFVPAIIVLDLYGLRRTLILASGLNLLGASIQCCGLNRELFSVVMIGQAITASAQGFILGLPPRLAAVWFSEKERDYAIGLGVGGNQLGVALGFLLPPRLAYIDADVSKTRHGLMVMFTSTTALSAITFALINLIVRSHPREANQRGTRINFCNDARKSFSAIKKMFSNKYFILLTITYGMITGCYYAWGTLLYGFISEFFMGDDVAQHGGQIGLTFTIAGIVAMILFGPILDRLQRKKKYYKQINLVINALALVSLAAFTGLLYARNIWLIYVVSGILGFFLTGYLALGFSFVLAITEESHEGTSAGVLNSSAQIFGIVLTISQRVMLENFGSLWANGLACAVLVPSLIMSGFLLRVKYVQREEETPPAELQLGQVEPVPVIVDEQEEQDDAV